MTHNEQLREQITNNLIANECALDHVTGGAAAAKEIQIPGTDRVMYIGRPADVARLLAVPVSAAGQPAGDLTDEQIDDVWEATRKANPQMFSDSYDFRLVFAHAIARAAIAAHLERQAQAAPAAREQAQAEPSTMSTDEAREYLVQFMENYFTDKTFHRYIRGRIGGSGPLAADFAWQMARALRMILATPSAAAAPASQEGAHAALDEVRNQALEEAAEVCENNICECCYTAEHCVEDIRALKTPASAERSGE